MAGSGKGHVPTDILGRPKVRAITVVGPIEHVVVVRVEGLDWLAPFAHALASQIQRIEDKIDTLARTIGGPVMQDIQRVIDKITETRGVIESVKVAADDVIIPGIAALKQLLEDAKTDPTKIDEALTLLGEGETTLTDVRDRMGAAIASNPTPTEPPTT